MEKDFSNIFQMDMRKYVTAHLKRIIVRYLWLPILLLIAFGIPAMSDSRFIFVCLILLFVVYPMALNMVWFSLVGSKSMTRNLRPQRWCIDESGTLSIDFFPFPKVVVDEATGQKSIVAEDSEPTACQSLTVKPEEVAMIENNGSSINVILSGKTLDGKKLKHIDRLLIAPTAILPQEVWHRLIDVTDCELA